ncbi:MAG: methyltransferase domain-containing protein [Deltaproteobacteria bacterium]|nr:methyltransferase domain-containing protein [Deltaproteobacteria bacterium]MBI3390793.1 methyltransferase domain-containing protein [Deltaproteobacteria bacterium]
MTAIPGFVRRSFARLGWQRFSGAADNPQAPPHLPITVLPAATHVPALDEDWLYWPNPDEHYQAMLAGEARYWRGGDPLNELIASQPRTQRRYFAFMNETLTGDAGTPWYRAITRGRRFARAASLGSSGGTVEAELLRHGVDEMVLYDLGGAPPAGTYQMPRSVRARCRWEAADLNFAALPEHHFDLILDNSALHHIVNLEHVLFQIRRALRPDGVLAVSDYIGPARFQHSQTAREIADAVRRALPASLRRPGLDCMENAPLGEAWPHSPFESVRSSDIVPLLHHFFEPAHWIELNGLWFLLGFKLDPKIYREHACLEWLLRLDLELTRACVMPATLGVGLFRPRATAATQANRRAALSEENHP